MDRVEQLNQRLAQRNITSTTPSFYFSPRPVSTKYTTFPILDQFKPSTVEIPYKRPYDVQKEYLPSTSLPFSGFIENIDIETKLRHEKDYIPSSKSSLYVKPMIPSEQTIQPYPGLFADVTTTFTTPTFKDKHLFYNSTSKKINL